MLDFCLIGEINIHKLSGQVMTITSVLNNKYIEIEFEDGTIIYPTLYDDFKNGTVQHPKIVNPIKYLYIGETNKAKNGQLMTIIDYRNIDDIDIQFEDKTIITNIKYLDFKNGYDTYNNRKECNIGRTKIANNGQKMTIIDYKSSNDITIKFEDNTIVYHKSIIAFTTGYIKNPNFQLPYQINNVIVESKAYIYKS